MRSWILTTMLFMVFFVTSVQATECDEACQMAIVKDYYTAVDRMWGKGSTIEDLDAVMSFFHEDAKYEHPSYGANFTKSSFRTASLRQLEAGNYDNENRETRILNSIHGNDHAAIEYSYGTLKADGQWEQGKVKFALFGFKDGKISLVREYW